MTIMDFLLIALISLGHNFNNRGKIISKNYPKIIKYFMNQNLSNLMTTIRINNLMKNLNYLLFGTRY